MASLVDGGILLLQGPRGVGYVHRHPVIAPLAEESSSWVVDVVEIFGKVGFTSEGGDEVLPGGGRFKLRDELGY